MFVSFFNEINTGVIGKYVVFLVNTLKMCQLEDSDVRFQATKYWPFNQTKVLKLYSMTIHLISYRYKMSLKRV